MKHFNYALGLLAALAMTLSACGGTEAAAPAEQTASSPAQTASSAAQTTTSPAPAALTPAQIQAADTLDRSSSVAGPDANGDGIRDDINRWINAQTLTPAQKAAVTKNAQTMQQTLLVDSSDREAARRVSLENWDALDCVRATFERKSKEPSRIINQIEAMTANTRERAKKYIAYNAALNGMSFSMKAEPTCD